MTADEYLWKILAREAVDTGPNSQIMVVAKLLYPILQEWGAHYLVGIQPSGSFAKGTANRSGTDIDLFVSLVADTPVPLEGIFENLFHFMDKKGFGPKRQNVSINIKAKRPNVNELISVDIVPARRQPGPGDDHSLYRSRQDTWTKTNIQKHIAHVRQANRIAESRVVKLWRKQKGLEFPSFYVELAVIAALQGKQGGVAANVWEVFSYLANGFSGARIVDPANTANIISDDLTNAEKAAIKSAAAAALKAKTWEEIVK